jgi:hypothetical protein
MKKSKFKRGNAKSGILIGPCLRRKKHSFVRAKISAYSIENGFCFRI